MRWLSLIALVCLPCRVGDSATILGTTATTKFVTSGGGGGTPAYVGITTATDSSGTTISASRTCTAGNTLVVCLSWEDSAPTTSVADGSNTYTGLTVQNGTSNNSNGRLFYAKNITGGSLTITATFGSSVAFSSMNIVELSGCSTSAPFDQEGNGLGTSTAALGADFTTTSANEVLVCLIKNYGGTTVTPQASWTEDYDGGVTGGKEIQHRVVNATGTFHGAGTLANSEAWIVCAASFK